MFQKMLQGGGGGGYQFFDDAINVDSYSANLEVGKDYFLCIAGFTNDESVSVDKLGISNASITNIKTLFQLANYISMLKIKPTSSNVDIKPTFNKLSTYSKIGSLGIFEIIW